MKTVELILDAAFLVAAVGVTMLVIRKGKRFDKCLALLTCTAWALKGIRMIFFDWVQLAVKNGQITDPFAFLKNTGLALDVLDVLVFLFLSGVLLRLLLLWLYSRWYDRARKNIEE